jgi:hypothetical protein
MFLLGIADCLNETIFISNMNNELTFDEPPSIPHSNTPRCFRAVYQFFLAKLPAKTEKLWHQENAKGEVSPNGYLFFCYLHPHAVCTRYDKATTKCRVARYPLSFEIKIV